MRTLHQATHWAMHDLEHAGINPMAHLELAQALIALYRGLLGGEHDPENHHRRG